MTTRKLLTLKQEKFCEVYAKTLNGGQSYKTAYDPEGRLESQVWYRRACHLLKKPNVMARVEGLRKVASDRSAFGITEVLAKWVAIATADPNDLIQHRRLCCRYCYGVNHQYQWHTTEEYALACARAFDRMKPAPPSSGGYGFNATLEAVATCPGCFGEGQENIYVADTRKLTGGAKALYAGLKKTREGVQILMRDQDDALRNIAKYLGMFKEQIEVKNSFGKNLMSVSTVTQDPVQAAKIYQQLISES